MAESKLPGVLGRGTVDSLTSAEDEAEMIKAANAAREIIRSQGGVDMFEKKKSNQ